ncbi:MAG: glucose-1-phosphate thymidylyltransferase [Candidatus Nitrohelix vancouverensis]|uniref:Glucose-1-phosphate thymidylyltransferase n=1 Tax=Candidatus Nitrohelix vancouverensis TaxID=2705534 RepID=A0A7T0C1G2_9BACT|nr:MAG: glucose-1-phosphate thymidylyltransferase [Candidatus Nitrohelix vancouverensis]
MPKTKDFSLFSGAFFEDPASFKYAPHLQDFKYSWEVLPQLESILNRILTDKKKDAVAQWQGIDASSNGVFVQGWVELDRPVFFESARVWLDAGVLLEPTAIIKGPAVIGAHTSVRQGAYIRGNALIGEHCVIGHATELKNSIIMNHSEAGHFNYIGDSILGSHVNMGAGSRLANLQFRTAEEKLGGFIHPIEFESGNHKIQTQVEKLGSLLGDHAELGCNVTLCPGTLLGRRSWVYPNTTVSKGFYPPKSFIVPKERKTKIQDQ